MKPKLRDVAEKAGVSLTAASMVLSDTGRISEDTRLRVLRAAEELGYKKKIRNSGRMPFDHVCILFKGDYEWAFIFNFIRPLIESIESNLKKAGLNLILIPIYPNENSPGDV